MAMVPLWINAALAREKAEDRDAFLLGKSVGCLLAMEPSGVFPRHPATLTVEIKALGQTVLPDLDPLRFVLDDHAEIDRWAWSEAEPFGLRPKGSLLLIPASDRLTGIHPNRRSPK